MRYAKENNVEHSTCFPGHLCYLAAMGEDLNGGHWPQEATENVKRATPERSGASLEALLSAQDLFACSAINPIESEEVACAAS
jgi:hypothetical protein